MNAQTIRCIGFLYFFPFPHACDATVLSACADMSAQMHASHIPDLAVAVFDHGKIQTAYCAPAPATPPSPDAIFEAASLSKPVFAAGVLRLAAEKRLNLDRPLSAYLGHPYAHEQNAFGPGAIDIVTDPRLSRITARMVLSHSSGLPNWARKGPLHLQDDPGRRWSYSAEGYVYLQKVVETITAVPLDTFMRVEVLRPLGMLHSSFVWQNSFAGALLVGHAASGAPEKQTPFMRAVASSTLYTTLSDYARFVDALLRPDRFAWSALEVSRQVAVRHDLRLAWGLGVALEDGQTQAIFHWGANPGYQSFFLGEPHTGRAVLFFTDSDNGLDLVDAMVKRYVPGPHPALKLPMLHPKD